MSAFKASSRRPRWSSTSNYECHSFPSHKHQFRLQPRSCVISTLQSRQFHDYFVTHLPSSSLHPDSRSRGPHHKLPRSASTPHTGPGPSPAAAPGFIGGLSRELTVVRIPLRKAKHHFGVYTSRGQRPYNEDTYQAGTIEIPAFAKRAPISLSRNPKGGLNHGEGTSADSASGDPQVFYFAIFDGHGGSECSEFLREDLHNYVEESAEKFGLTSSLKQPTDPRGKSEDEVQEISLDRIKQALNKESPKPVSTDRIEHASAASSLPPMEVPSNKDKPSTLELEQQLIKEWKMNVGGYFRRFKPEYFITSTEETSQPPATSIEAVLMYAFLSADLEFVSAQAQKPDSTNTEVPVNNDEVLGYPSRQPKHHIGGRTRFAGGSTASVAMISTPTPMPFWHPSSPSTLVVAHVGDTRALLCSTQTGSAVPLTTDHHPSSPIESARLRRYAATFVTDSFGEERMSGLANTRAFGDMRSKRIGVSAEPEVGRYEMGPAEYSFLVLVSDGVSGTLTDQEIVDIVKEAKTPEDGSRDVVTFATEVSRDGDNATCLVIRLGGWERRGEGGGGSLGTKEMRDFKRQEANDPRKRRR